MIGDESFVKAKPRKEAGKIQRYLQTLAAVPDRAAVAYHSERLASRVLTETARSRAHYFLRDFPPEITGEASEIVDEACKQAACSGKKHCSPA